MLQRSRIVLETGETLLKYRLSITCHTPRPKTTLMVLAWMAFSSVLFAQQPASTLPDAPQAQKTADNDSSPIGFITNKSFFFPAIATSSGPLTTGQKFELFVNQSVSPPYIVLAAASAGINQARNDPEAWGQGGEAYGKRFGSALARASSSSFFGTFVFASLLHQDPRFFPQAKPTFWGSVKYSAREVFVTRKDSGGETFNASGLGGPLAAEALANAYLPVSEQTGEKTMTRYGTEVLLQFGGNMFQNYWPVIRHRVVHHDN